MANFLPKSDREFRVGHVCCSSSSPDDGERRRRRSDLDGDDIAESSAAARRHSRLLSRWVARQTEDIITTIERRNRESELLALTSLHTVLESSFLRPPPQPPSSAQPTPTPTPISAASSILRRWRELEDEAQASSRSGSSSSSSREQSPESGESERVREIIRGMTESARVSPESPRAEWLGETERERVRHVREWVQTATQRRDDERERRRREDGTLPRDAPRIRGRQARLDLIMRIVRERQRELQGLQEHRAVSDFAHRNRIQSFLRGRFLRNGRPVEDERSPSVAARELGQLQQRNPVSGLRREGFHYGLENIVHGQASSILDSSTRTNSSGSRNDQSQLTSTVELSSENHVEYQSRSETSGILQTIQEHATAEFDGTIPNESTDWQESATRENWQEVDTEQGESDWQHPSEIGFSEWQDGTREESEVNWQENIDQEWSRETPEDEDEDEESHILEENDEWHENDAHENVENWEGGPSDPPRDQHSVPLRRVGRFILPDDDNVYSIELRELLSRRSVSNLLRSGFRESLDHLIQSYVERQGHTPLDWHLERQLPSPDSPEQDQGLGREEPHQEQQGVARPPFVLSSPPVPPPQPLWHSGLRHSNWTRQSMHRPEIEWDIINDLRADMAKLQQGMSHMQRMLEACMDMQLELQRAVRQEVSAALNRSTDGKGLGEETSDYGSKWAHVRKGTCCVCCDTHIDALLYRCGHMCTCLKCANELVRGGGKCPLCRAPIVEVIRAYSIL
ncbi:uncharacterized protein M6B38_353150 [Iris pallida]|uniref:RING-type domain-containing protein n=1 Tax=Iris pallida TaxID=29817 RepID=A0AAX6GPG9_IRIPA|nr:uncharacterized protein M6B38_353150 [Iris pallida]